MTGYCVFECKKGRGSKNQKSGKCDELSRQSIKFVFLTHPTPGGLGVKISKVRKKNHELSRKSIKKIPPSHQRGRSGNFSGSKNQKSGKCHELPRKVITKINPTPPHQGLGVLKGKHFKCQTFHELEKIDIFVSPPPTPSDGGGVRGENVKVTISIKF